MIALVEDRLAEAAEGKDLDAYRRDGLFRQAIERNLEIIGEAIGRIVRLLIGPDAPSTPPRVTGTGPHPSSSHFPSSSSTRVREGAS